jgi:hypothetical protein
VVEAFPGSRSAEAFHRLAAQIIGRWPMPRTASGYLQFFIERLINPAYAPQERWPNERRGPVRQPRRRHGG